MRSLPLVFALIFSSLPLTAWSANCKAPVGLSADLFTLIEGKQADLAVQMIAEQAKNLRSSDRNAACETYFHVAIRTSQAKVLNQLVASGLDVKDMGYDYTLGTELMTYVFQNGSLAIARKYLDRGASVPDLRIAGTERSLMTTLVYYSNFGAIDSLIAQDADEAKGFITALLKIRLTRDEASRYSTLRSPEAAQALKRVVGQLKSSDIDPSDYALIAMMEMLEKGMASNAVTATYAARTSLEPKARAANLKKLKETLEAKTPNATVIAEILATGISPNEQIEKGETLLMAAIAQGDLATVKILLKSGADAKAEFKNDQGAIPVLSYAALKADRLEIFDAILDAGGTFTNRAIVHAYLTAISAQNRRAMEKLVKLGASVNAQVSGLATPLQVAARSKKTDMLRLLLAQGANPNLPDAEFGYTALMLAVANDLIEPTRVLLAAGADAGAVTKAGQSTLFFAVTSRNPEIVSEILAKRPALETAITAEYTTASPTAKTYTEVQNTTVVLPKKSTALAAAVRLRQPKIAKLLLAAGADVNAVDEKGITPFKIAFYDINRDVYNGRKEGVEMVKILLEKGPSVDFVTENGQTPVGFAAGFNDSSLLEAMLKTKPNLEKLSTNSYGGEITPLMIAVRDGARVKNVELLLAAGANPNTGAKDGTTALHIAARGFEETVKLLLDAGANPNLRSSDGETPLHEAVRSGKLEIVQMLRRAGAKMDAQNEKGESPLHIAIEKHDREIIDYLITASSSSLEIRDHSGRTALILAVIGAERNYDCGRYYSPDDCSTANLKTYAEITRRLIKAGANRKARDNDNKSAFSYSSFKVWGPQQLSLK